MAALEYMFFFAICLARANLEIFGEQQQQVSLVCACLHPRPPPHRYFHSPTPICFVKKANQRASLTLLG
jgi:hypothetical protein